MLWLNKMTGVVAACEQLDAEGVPLPGQELVKEDDPYVQAILNPPVPAGPPSRVEIIEALKSLADGDRTAIDLLAAKI